MQSSENNLITCLCSSYWCASLCNRHLLCYRTDFEAGVRDFKERLAYYEKVYEPVEEGSYIKMIDMVSGKGGQLQVCVNSQATHVKVASKVLFLLMLN